MQKKIITNNKIGKDLGRFFLKPTLMVILLLVVFVQSQSFNQIKNKAQRQKQTVYFNAWGGDSSINDYLSWTIRETKKRFGVKIIHVKINDTAIAVNRVLAEKQANKNTQGSVDLIWINGENFKTMKNNGLLYGPFTDKIPNVNLVDFENKQFTLVDFSVPTDGYEAPWGTAKLVFFYDSRKIKKPSQNADQLLSLAKKHPGRITYPKPPDFNGSTFIKQILLEKVKDHTVFQRPITNNKKFKEVTHPLWKFLDEFHSYTWRRGKSFPKSISVMYQMLNDGELYFGFSFNPNKALNLIERGEIPSTIKTFVHKNGTLANAHFLAIPYNSSAKEAAMVYINFLLSAEAQAKKANYKVWGDPTVLSMTKLPSKDKIYFNKINRSNSILSDEELGRNYLEPHASWVEKLEKEWLRRYGS